MNSLALEYDATLKQPKLQGLLVTTAAVGLFLNNYFSVKSPFAFKSQPGFLPGIAAVSFG